jgi:hypothetical protein
MATVTGTTRPATRPRLAALIGGYFPSQAIYVAARLGIADELRSGPRTADDLARTTGADSGALRRLLRTLAGFGIFCEVAAGRFRLTSLGRWLRSDVPDSLRPEALALGELYYPVFAELLNTVKTGRPGFDRVFGKPLFHYLAEHAEAARVFNEGLAHLRAQIRAAVLEVYDFSAVRRLVDVGGGDGSLLAALLDEYPAMTGTLFDLPEVIEQARPGFRAVIDGDRCLLCGGDFFETVPQGGDAYLLRHILHDWGDEQVVQILKNCRRAMRRSDKLIVIESVIRSGNELTLGKVLDLVMLAVTGGRERTEPEYRALLEASGFRLTRVIKTDAGIDVIEAVPG